MNYSYNQLHSKEKQKVRDKIITTIQKEFKGKYSVRGLSLPNLNFNIEDTINKSFKESCVDCLEIDPKVYNRQLSLPMSNNKFFYKEDVFKWLKTTWIKGYDWMFLDFCGALQNKVKNNLLELVQSDKLKDNCIIAITLLKGREAANVIKFTNKLNITPEQWRTTKLVEDLQFFAQQKNRSVKLLWSKEYSSELQKTASTMKVLVLKVKQLN